MSPGSTDKEKSYIFSTLCLPTIRDVGEDAHDRADCGIIVCFIMKQLVRHLDVDKSMGGESCKTMRAGMVKSFVNYPIRSFVEDN
ncbi:hypothetical protein CsSME_00052694 [Camellia sinensis var. sinensis]